MGSPQTKTQWKKDVQELRYKGWGKLGHPYLTFPTKKCFLIFWSIELQVVLHMMQKTKIRNSYGNIHFWRWGKLGQGALTFPTHKIMSIFVKFLVWLCYDSEMLFYVIYWNTSHIKDLFRAFNWFKLSYNNMRKDHAHSISGPANGRDMRFSPKHVPYAH